MFYRERHKALIGGKLKTAGCRLYLAGKMMENN
jgi:hypothetical protein